MATGPWTRPFLRNPTSLKRSQPSMEDRATCSRSLSRQSSKSPTHCSRRTGHSSQSLLSSPNSTDLPLPRASVPRTVEILWGGRKAPGFTLKCKRTGAILVSTVTHETQVATTLQVGSELKLVGGFPVNRLTLQDMKKVMLLAPKPVSLVFVTADDVVMGHVGDMQELRAERNNRSSTAHRSMTRNTTRPVNLQRIEHGRDNSDTNNTFSTSTPTFYSEMSENHTSKKRKVSKLQVALVRVNQLLHRPVRQAGLHVGVGKSIVV